MTNLPKKLAHLKIPLDDIQSATDNFADENLIREGGFGRIYRGKLTRSGKTIDIVARRFDTKYWGGSKEFWTEILMLYSLKDQKLVSLVGFCEENGEKIIVNKHEANGSLDQYLSDPAFTWTRRLKVCLDVALALRYIHYNKQRNFSVIHRNLKSSKILLDEKWEAKISGFELSKINPLARRHGLVLAHDIFGTYAYVDPAYVKSGGVTHKSDVYSLGVILFEIMCGKKAIIQYKDEGSVVFEGVQGLSKISLIHETAPDDEGNSPRLEKSYSMGKLQEVVNDEGHAPTMTKPHSMGKLQEVVNDEGHAPTMTKPHSNEGILDNFKRDGQPPSFSSYEPLPFTIQPFMLAPSFFVVSYPSIGSSFFVNMYQFSFTGVENSDNDRYAALYMTTSRNLKYMQVPKEGLLSQLAKSHYEAGNLDDIIHPGLRVQMDSQSLAIFSEAAYCSLKEQRAQRPDIDRIISALKKALERQQNSILKEHSIVAAKGTTSISHLEVTV